MTRAKQRFHNFEQAMNQLREALKTEKPSFLELSGIIKLFELSFELGSNFCQKKRKANPFDLFSSFRETIF